MVLVVKVGAVARPEALVTTGKLPPKLPPVPLTGAVKVTLTPWTRLPAALRTSTARFVAKAVLTVADWVLPAATVSDAGASSSWMVPVAGLPLSVIGTTVLSSTDTVLEPLLATARSGRPSPLTSAAATAWGLLPVAKVCGAAKLGAAAPGAVVFSSTDTVAEPKFATARSGVPSPLTSAAATAKGRLPAAKVCGAAKLGAAAPGAVVFSNTDTVVE